MYKNEQVARNLGLIKKQNTGLINASITNLYWLISCFHLQLNVLPSMCNSIGSADLLWFISYQTTHWQMVLYFKYKPIRSVYFRSKAGWKHIATLETISVNIVVIVPSWWTGFGTKCTSKASIFSSHRFTEQLRVLTAMTSSSRWISGSYNAHWHNALFLGSQQRWKNFN